MIAECSPIHEPQDALHSGSFSMSGSSSSRSSGRETLPSDPDIRALLNDRRLSGQFRRGELGRVGSLRLRKVLGAGAMGIAFLAEDVDTRRLACWKALRPSLAPNARAVERFRVESETLSRIEHPNLVRGLGSGALEADARGGLPIPYLLMSFAPGKTLADHLQDAGPLPRRDLYAAALGLAEGLAALHAAGLVHRDLKPHNVIYDAQTRSLTILDLGLCKSSIPGETPGPDHRLAGTPAYMAPEQVRGGPVDFRSDLFALGTLLYTVASGRCPFEEDALTATLYSVVAEQPESLLALRPSLRPAFVELVSSLLDKDPARRPESADDVARHLRTGL